MNLGSTLGSPFLWKLPKSCLKVKDSEYQEAASDHRMKVAAVEKAPGG